MRISELSWNVAAVLSAGGNPLRPHGSPVMSPSQSATLPFPSPGKLTLIENTHRHSILQPFQVSRYILGVRSLYRCTCSSSLCLFDVHINLLAPGSSQHALRFLQGGHGAPCRVAEVDVLVRGTSLQINVRCTNVTPELVASLALSAVRCSGGGAMLAHQEAPSHGLPLQQAILALQMVIQTVD